MAPIGGPTGGGQSGFGSGGSFTGPAEALEIIGDFAYAYSGKMSTNTSVQTALSFTTGNYVFVGRIQCTGPVSEVTAQNGRISTWRMELNTAVIGYIKADTTDDFEGTTPSYVEVIIPPYTVVDVYVDSNSTDSDFYNSVMMAGRIYRE